MDGGSTPPPLDDDLILVQLSPGGPITSAEEAEALGLGSAWAHEDLRRDLPAINAYLGDT